MLQQRRRKGKSCQQPVVRLMRHKEGERALAGETTAPSELPQELQNNPGTDWVSHATEVARSFGKMVGEKSVQCFNWARNALKATARR